mgnify:CR=1 FL=1
MMARIFVKASGGRRADSAERSDAVLAVAILALGNLASLLGLD